MAKRISRRQISHYVAKKLIDGEDSVIDEVAALLVIDEVAALLVNEKRVRETELLVRDIEGFLAENGLIVATVTTANPLTNEARRSIIDKLAVSGGKVQLREVVDADVLGGCKIETPSQMLDATIQKKLNQLKASKT